MSIEIYLEKMRQIQENLLNFIESEDDNLDQSFQKIKQMLLDTQIQNNIYEFKSFLHLVNKISNNHNRKINFICKIEKILILFKNEMQKYLTFLHLTKEFFYFYLMKKSLLSIIILLKR